MHIFVFVFILFSEILCFFEIHFQYVFMLSVFFFLYVNVLKWRSFALLIMKNRKNGSISESNTKFIRKHPISLTSILHYFPQSN